MALLYETVAIPKLKLFNNVICVCYANPSWEFLFVRQRNLLSYVQKQDSFVCDQSSMVTQLYRCIMLYATVG